MSNIHRQPCDCRACVDARYAAHLVLVEAMHNPAPPKLAAAMAAQWDAAKDNNIPSIARLG